jgi:hypothetical protein
MPASKTLPRFSYIVRYQVFVHYFSLHPYSPSPVVFQHFYAPGPLDVLTKKGGWSVKTHRPAYPILRYYRLLLTNCAIRGSVLFWGLV